PLLGEGPGPRAAGRPRFRGFLSGFRVDGGPAATQGAGDLRAPILSRRQGRLSERPAARDELPAAHVRALSRACRARAPARGTRAAGEARWPHVLVSNDESHDPRSEEHTSELQSRSE